MRKLFHFRIRGRILAIVALSLLITGSIGYSMFETMKQNSYGLRQTHLRDVVDVTVSQLEALDAAVAAGDMTRDAAIEAGVALINTARYDGGNYLFAFTYDLSLMAHGRNPARRGEDVSGFSDPNGVRVYAELAQIARAEGGGAVGYSAKRSKDDAALIPKISYARDVPKWGWVVATGSYVEDIEAQLAADRATALFGLLAGGVMLALAGWLIGQSVTRPIARLNARMRGMAEGDIESAIPCALKRDEVGEMARSVESFQHSIQRTAALEREAEQRKAEREAAEQKAREDAALHKQREAELRAASERKAREIEAEQAAAAERAREAVEAERAKQLHQQQQVVSALAQALDALADGDLCVTLDTAFPAEYEALRTNFNEAVQKLQMAMQSVVDNAGHIRSEATSISGAADDLSRRTEQQAAALSETATALDRLTTSVRSSATGAHEADQIATGARQNAQETNEIVCKAVDAMQEIERSSGQINKIIDVIEEIAFQTNLLALNAGVEAARAGEAGRGFAVVASEVRALAQRSADAAKEINELIGTSGEHVRKGVDLVGTVGEALTQIIDNVDSMSARVRDIAAAARDQSTGLSEINIAMTQLDETTQRNAAMFEESTAASHSLANEAEALDQTAAHFHTALQADRGAKNATTAA